MDDLISRQAAIDCFWGEDRMMRDSLAIVKDIRSLPSAEPKRRYTEEELMVFQHGISLRLLSKRSAQHWCYDADTAIEIEFLERLYEKVRADMRGENNEQ